jgi:hypothetical protein
MLSRLTPDIQNNLVQGREFSSENTNNIMQAVAKYLATIYKSKHCSSIHEDMIPQHTPPCGPGRMKAVQRNTGSTWGRMLH